MWWLQGIQTPPPETAVVPPTTSAFSSTSTDAPSSAATTAPVSAGRAGADDDEVSLLVPRLRQALRPLDHAPYIA